MRIIYFYCNFCVLQRSISSCIYISNFRFVGSNRYCMSISNIEIPTTSWNWGTPLFLYKILSPASAEHGLNGTLLVLWYKSEEHHINKPSADLIVISLVEAEVKGSTEQVTKKKVWPWPDADESEWVTSITCESNSSCQL